MSKTRDEGVVNLVIRADGSRTGLSDGGHEQAVPPELATHQSRVVRFDTSDPRLRACVCVRVCMCVCTRLRARCVFALRHVCESVGDLIRLRPARGDDCKSWSRASIVAIFGDALRHSAWLRCASSAGKSPKWGQKPVCGTRPHCVDPSSLALFVCAWCACTVVVFLHKRLGVHRALSCIVRCETHAADQSIVFHSDMPKVAQSCARSIVPTTTNSFGRRV